MLPKTNQANWIQYVTAILVIGALAFSYGAYTKDVSVNVPTAASIAALVNVSVPTSTNNSNILSTILKQVDTRTDVSTHDKNRALSYANSKLSTQDFKNLISGLIDIDYSDFTIVRNQVKDTDVTTATKKDNDDGNFLAQKFIRIVYHDIDANDNEVVYVLLNAEITDLYNLKYNKDVSYSVSEVTRTFESD